MKKQLFTIFTLSLGFTAFAQVGIHTENPQGTFHVDGAKDNSPTGVPTVAQQANDLTMLNNGYVGIGTTSPQHQLHIVEANSTSNLSNINTPLNGIAITGSGLGTTDNWKGPGLYFENTSAPTGKRVAKLNYTQTSTDPFLAFDFLNDDATGFTGSTVMSLTHSGRVGINNIVVPSSNLSIQGNASIGGNFAAPTNGLLINGNTGLGILSVSLVNKLSILGTVVIGPAASPYFSTAGPAGGLAVSGSVGIGTITPQKKLHVVGGLQITSELNVGGTATTAGSAGTTGQVLVSNGAGNAPSWQAASSGTEVDGVIGNEVLNATTGGALTRAGAGTTADPYTLDVADQGITTAKIADNNVTYAKINTPVTNVTGNYTLLESDKGGFVYVTSVAAANINVPDTLSSGFHCVVIQQGAGQVTVTGNNLTTARGLKTRTQYSAIGVIKRGPGITTVTGDGIN